MHYLFVSSARKLMLPVLLLLSISLQAQKSVSKGGDLIKAESIGSFDQTKLSRIVNEELAEFLNGSPMPFENFKGKFDAPVTNVQLFKLTYWTTIPEKGNQPTVVTGLVAIPEKLRTGNPIISYQHGTVFGHDQVPSQPDNSMETKLMLSQFGGQGYIVIGADYIGLGDSKLPNSYFSRKSNEEACMDMYKAAMTFLKKKQIQTGPFFTVGWSQGAYNNMTFLRRLEEAKIPVTASVTAATPVDINLFITRGVTNPRTIDAVFTPACLSNMFFALSYYSNMPDLPARAIRPEYLQVSRDFYEFKVDWMTHLKKTTSSAIDFVRPEFIAELKSGRGKLVDLLNSMEAYRWVSVTPLRAYSGQKDEVIPYYLGQLGIEYQAVLGKKNGMAINAGENADHRATFVFAVIDFKPWFDSFLK